MTIRGLPPPTSPFNGCGWVFIGSSQVVDVGALGVFRRRLVPEGTHTRRTDPTRCELRRALERTPARTDRGPRSDTEVPGGHPQEAMTRGHRVLPRKEVIQPQLPLRLPCYDFTLLTGRTFGSFLPKGLVHRLRVQQTRVV